VNVLTFGTTTSTVATSWGGAVRLAWRLTGAWRSTNTSTSLLLLMQRPPFSRATRYVTVAFITTVEQHQRTRQREESPDATCGYPGAAALTRSAAVPIASAATVVHPSQRQNPWITPGQRTSSTGTPASRSAAA